MSDAEHELVVENRALRRELERLRAVARDAITRAIAELDRTSGRHDARFDEALDAVEGASVDPADGWSTSIS